jgi:AcrR family transcriptional regulator
MVVPARRQPVRRQKGTPNSPSQSESGGQGRAGTVNTVMSDRRATILEAATQRFAEFGFAATTVRQISQDVNILSGSLYHHFTTKDEMLHEIVRARQHD